jgi:hypothetical protein
VLAAVLPGGEPEQYQAHVVLASRGQKPVDRRKIEISRLLFDLIPVNGYFNRVGVQILHVVPVFGLGRPGAL